MTSLTVMNQTINTNGGLYSLTDLHKSAGGENKHKPSYFMANQTTKDLITEIESDNQIAYNTIIGKGKNQGTFVCRELVYAYAMWISAKFHLLVIRAFDNLNTGAVPCLSEPVISNEQAAQIQKAIKTKCKHNKLHYQTIYHALYDEFHVKKYTDLLADDFERAMDFIRDYRFALDGLCQHILADTHAHAIYTQDSIDEIIQHLHPIVEHLNRIKGRAISQQRLISAYPR